MEWLRHLYDEWRDSLGARWPVPGFDEFWAGDGLELPVASEPQVAFAGFRLDPDQYPLSTPSGKIEIFSSTIDGYQYPDCPGHPVWLEPDEWLGSAAARRFGLQLVANQPKARLHSQLDMGAHSQSVKIAGREPVRMNPGDAQARRLRDGDLVRIFNDRGACLAGLAVDEAVRPGVAQLSTGAWYDPDPADPGFCRHGNPNVLTADRPSSTLSQGCTGQLALVEVEAYRGSSAGAVGHPAPRDRLTYSLAVSYSKDVGEVSARYRSAGEVPSVTYWIAVWARHDQYPA